MLMNCAEAATHTVGPTGYEFTKIQDAINAATPGDTIVVYSGTYYEHVNVNKQLTLQGSSSPVVDAEETGSAITLSADGCTLKGFVATNSGTEYPCAGISVTSDNNTIEGNTVSDNKWDGISLDYSSGNTIFGNTVTDNAATGIYLRYSSDNTIKDNTANSNGLSGISLWPSSQNNVVIGNTANYNTQNGIYVGESIDNTIEDNAANNNGYDGISLYPSSENNIVKGNIATGNTQSGLYLGSFSNSNTISGNTATGNDYGIYISSSDGNTIYLNTFDNTKNARSISVNTWHSPTEIEHGGYTTYVGNRWSDYTGSDSNGDGIGDSPYEIPGGSEKDYYPIIMNVVFPGESIQAAINAANSGDTIIVLSGTYRENVVVDKQLTLWGVDTGTGQPIVDAGGSGSAITLSADGCTLEGFVATKSGSGWPAAGVTVTSNGNTISGNIVTCNEWDGIYLCDSSGNTISGNTATDNNIGIVVQSSSGNNIVIGNTANSNRCGIYLYSSSKNNTISGNTANNNSWSGIDIYLFCTNNTISENTATDNDYGIRVASSIGNTIYQNTFNNIYNAWSDSTNTWNSPALRGNRWSDYAGRDCDGDGIGDVPYDIPGGSERDEYPLTDNAGARILSVCASGCNYTSIQDAIDAACPGDTIEVQSGIYYENVNVSKQLTLRGVDNGSGLPVVDADGSGDAITLSADGCTLEGFVARNSYTGIRVYSDGNTILGNNATGNSQCGIHLTIASNNIISGNTAAINTINGIDLDQSSNNTILGNTATRNSIHGIVVYYSSNNTISGNDATSNSRYGIWLSGSSGNTISDNTATGNTRYGILLSSSSCNTIYQNTFNNTNNSWSDSTNAWNSPALMGNHWSDYAGRDCDGDGIGDWPYDIPGGSELDENPLTDNAGARTLSVCASGCDYTSIQAAINAACPGDTIEVQSGIYYENVDVNKTLTLRGVDNGTGLPVVDAGGSGSAITLSADGCTLEGFGATNSGGEFPCAGISVTSDNNSISGNNVSSNNWDGISLDYSSANTISGNTVTDNAATGIYLRYSSDNTIEENAANSNGLGGISLWPSSENNIVIGNTANYNTQNGIYVGESNSNTVSGNTATGNHQYGIWLSSSSGNNTISDNTATGNILYGIHLSSSSGNTIYQNSFNNTNNSWSDSSNTWNSPALRGNRWSDYTGRDIDGDGIGDAPYNISGGSEQDYYPLTNNSGPLTLTVCASGCDYTRIQDAVNAALPGDTIEVWSGTYREHVNVSKQLTLRGVDTGTGLPVVDADGSGSAITLNADGCTLEGFVARNSYNGICVYSDGNTISGNNVTSNTYGIHLTSASDNIISGNTATINTKNGIDLDHSSNNTILGNTATRNTMHGIVVYYSSNNTVSGNDATNNDDDGILLSSSSGNTISDNTATENGNYGIYIYYSSGNTIYQNTFNNTNNSWSYSANTWNSPALIGNRWSDYAGLDMDRDGIGDTPYNISGGSEHDYYPLTDNSGPLTFTVCASGCDYTSIQAAINAACPGDTIEVWSGTYYENVVVNKSLTLRGMDTGTGQPIVHAGGLGNAITLSSDGCTLEGFVATNSASTKAGISVASSDNSIFNNIATLSKFGISLVSSSGNTISDNTATNNTHSGIDITYSSSNNIISSNVVTGNRKYGIVLYDSCNDNTVWSNAATGSERGVYLYSSYNNTISENTATGNSEYGISLASSSSNTISDNTATDSTLHGIHLSSSSDNTIYQNAFNNTNNAWSDSANTWNSSALVGNLWSDYTGRDIDGDGIGDVPYDIPGGSEHDDYPLTNNSGPLTLTVCASGCDYTSIQAAINSAWPGDTVEVQSGTYRENVIVNKTLTLRGVDTGTGLPVVDADGSGSAITLNADGCTLEGFVAKNAGSTGDSGIELTSHNNTISGNTVTANYHGIRLESSSGNTVSGNTATGNSWYGIDLYSSSENNISGNTATGSSIGAGIHLGSISNNNIVTGNNASNNNGYGISLGFSSENNVSGNIASGNDYGIRLDYSSGNTVTDNTANGNDYGIHVASSNGNTIYQNTFSNTNNARSDSANTWRSPEERTYQYKGTTYTNYTGNFWSDYEGFDYDGDGIGDLPHFIPGGSEKDDYPMMSETSGSPKITVTKTVFPPSSLPLYNVTFTINATNTGDVDLDEIVVRDQLPEGLEHILSTPVGTVDGRNITWALGKLAPGNSTVIELIARIEGGTAPGNLTNQVNATGVPSAGDNVTPGAVCDVVVSSIQEAIDAANPGDTIVVQSGTYYENVDVNKPLTLRGVGSPIVDAGGVGSAITISADGCTIEGFVTTNSGSYENDAGIKILSDDNIIENNNASFNGWNGFILQSSSGNTLRNNQMYRNGFSNFRADNAHEGNDIDTSNLVDGKPIYYLVDKSGIVIDSLTNAGVVFCFNCNGITVKDLKDISNNYYGIYFYNTINSKIEGCDLNSDDDSIVLAFSSGNDIRNNVVGDTGRNNGISLYSSDGNTLTNNTVNGNFYGIRLDTSSNNILKNNSANNNDCAGISLLSYSCDNLLEGNSVSGNNEHGIRVETDSNNNQIYLNKLNDNFKNAYSDSTNLWHSPEEKAYRYNGSTYSNYTGNFWSDYAGNDANEDGIGDSFYYIEGKFEQDEYPMTPGVVIDDSINMSEFNVKKTVYPSGGLPLYNVTFTINLTNTYEVDLSWVEVIDMLPGGLEYISSTPSGNVEGKNVVWTFDFLGSGNSTLIEMVAQIEDGTTPGILTNYINATAILPNGENVTDETSRDVFVGIQAAIDAASPGDTILVPNGTYYEHVNVNKQLTLLGVGSPVVDAGGSGSAITLNSDECTVKGFIVKNAGDDTWNDGGIRAGSNNNTIAENVASNNCKGISLFFSNGNIIEDNTAINNGLIGIYLMNSLYNTVSENTASNNPYGITLSASDNNTIGRNIASYSSEKGIHLSSSFNNLIEDNIASNNLYGIFIWQSGYNTVQGNSISESNSIYIVQSNYNKIYLNIFNNTGAAYSDSINLWRSPEKRAYQYNGSTYSNYTGNFWSNYAGTDANDDGIGDSPYLIAGGSERDDYPMMAGASIEEAELRLAINGSKFYDADGNGSWDSGEPGLEGWEVRLWDADNGTLINSTVTDLNGSYGFEVPAGNYTVSEALMPGWVQTYPPSGNYTISLTDYNATGIDFGNLPLPAGASIKVNKTSRSSGTLPGNEVFFTINVSNPGTSRLDPVILRDYLPSGLDYISSNPEGIIDGNDIVWIFGPMDPGNSTIVDLVARINSSASGILTNIVNATGAPTEGNNVTDVDAYEINVFESIQAAIDAASPGDTIVVPSGTYYENVVVNKQLTLRGVGSPIVDAGGVGSAITISADGCILEEFVARNSGDLDAGIDVTSNDNIITGNAVNGNSYGVRLDSSSNNTISSNSAINNTYNGLLLWSANSNIILKNEATGSIYDGILLWSANNNNVSGNTATGNDRSGIGIWSSSDNIITGNTAGNNNEGICLIESSGNTVTGNTATDNSGFGIVLDSSSDNNNVSGNTASDNRDTGIYLNITSDNNIISGNTANGNDWDGIILSFSCGNTITGNTASGNSNYGIYLFSSNANTFYLNAFDNTNNVWSDSSNTWRSPEERTYQYKGSTYTNYTGNFWSDYDGSDYDGDGIGDSPYSIPGGSEKDDYPMMPETSGTPKITVKKSVSPETATPATNITYLINITNTGDVDFEEVLVRDLAPSGLDQIGANRSGTVTGNEVDWNLGSLNVSESAHLQVTARIDGTQFGYLVNTVNATGFTLAGLKATDDDNVNLTVLRSGIDLNKTANFTAAGLGNVITYNISIANIGDSNLTNVLAYDNLTSATWDIGVLVPGQIVIVATNYTVTEEDVCRGFVKNIAVASAIDCCDKYVNASAYENVTIAVSNTSLNITEIANKAGPVGPGDEIVYNLTVRNEGTLAVTDVLVLDNLTGNFSLGTLNPGEDKSIITNYTVTETDVCSGWVNNSAYAVGTDLCGGPVTTETVEVGIMTDYNSSLSITKLANKAGPVGPGDEIVYNLTVRNEGTLAVTDVLVLDDLTGNFSLGTLNPGEDKSIITNYTVTETDVCSGWVNNSAYAVGTDLCGGPVTTETVEVGIMTDYNSSLSITKLANKAGPVGPGDEIVYNLTVRNEGTLAVTDVLVLDDLTGNFSLGTLNPGEEKSIITNYTVTETDVCFGWVNNSAYVVGTDLCGGPVTTETVEVGIMADYNSSLSITKVANKAGPVGPGDEIVYNLTVRNDGTVALNGVLILDDLTGNFSLGTLDPGEEKSVISNYTVTQIDVCSGWVNNSAYATGTDVRGFSVMAGPEYVKVSTGYTSSLNVTKVANTTGQVGPGDTILYRIKVINDGNVTLENVVIIDDKLGLVAPVGPLGPNQSSNITVNYAVTQEDLRLGWVNNTVFANGTDPCGKTAEDHCTETVETTFEAGLEVTKTADIEFARPGDQIVYTIRVENTGNCNLYNVWASDNLTDREEPLGILEPGEIQSFITGYQVAEDDVGDEIANKVVVTASDPRGRPIENFSEETVDTTAEIGIDLQKTSNRKFAEVGDLVTYSYRVQNIGNATIYDVNLTDDRLGPIGLAGTTLDPGEVFVASINYTVAIGDLPGPMVNVAVAEGSDSHGTTTNYTDYVSVALSLPPTDTEPPEVLAFNFGPKTINTSESSSNITFSARFTDDLSGLDPSSWARFLSPSANQSAKVVFDNLVSGDGTDGTYENIMKLPRYSEEGIWELDILYLQDNVSNQNNLSGDDMAAMGFPTKFVIDSGGVQDVEPPQVESFDFEPKIINTSGSAQVVTFTINLTDDLSGVGEDSLYVQFRSPSGEQFVEVLAHPSESLVGGNGTMGVYQCTITLPRYSEGGTWKLERVWIDDGVGNTVDLDLADMASHGFPTEIVVESISDTTPPEVETFDFEPKEVVTISSAQSIRFGARLVDDLSGVGPLSQARFLSPSGRQSATVHFNYLSSGNETNATYEGNATLPRYSENGTWELDSFTVIDNVGNKRTLNIENMTSRGFPAKFLVRTDPPGIENNSSIGDRVWDDSNGNGLQDEGEGGVPDVHVALLDENLTRVADTTTGPGGLYTFKHLLPGIYRLQFDAPAGCSLCSCHQGDEDLDSDADPATGLTDLIVLEADENETTIDAGLHASLNASKTADKKKANRGEELTYTIRICNDADLTAKDVVVEDVFDRTVEFISASPMPDPDGFWRFDEIPGKTCVEIVLVVRVPKQDLEFDMGSDVSGQGFVNVANDYSTTLQPYSITNRVKVTSVGCIVTDSETVSVSADLGTELSTREHGSGLYDSDELLRLRTENKSISMDKDVAATYGATAVGIYNNRTVNYSSRWTEEARAKNRITGASMSESYRYAISIDRESNLLIDKNGSTMTIDSEFEGMGHVGFLKKGSGSGARSASTFEAREDYVGSFKVLDRTGEYGSAVSSEKSALGEGLVAVDKRVGESQRSYESGTGTYDSEELIETNTNYIAKDISLVSGPMNYSSADDFSTDFYQKWTEGMYSKTAGTSLIGEEYTGLTQLDKETVAKGLNEMETEANFSGRARYRAVLRDEVDVDEQYEGDYSIQRRVLFSGVPEYDRPHLNVVKTLDGIVEETIFAAKETTLAGESRDKTIKVATYTISIENDGNRALGPIHVRDTFPPGANFINASLRPSELADAYANWTLTHLAIGDVNTLVLNLDVTEHVPDELVNRVEVCGGYNDDAWVCASNFSALEIEWLACCPDETVSVAKTAQIDETNPRVIWYRIEVENQANVTRVATVTDSLPEGMILLDAKVPFASCENGTVVWNLPEIGPFETMTIDYTAEALWSGRFENSVEVEARSVDGQIVQPVGAKCLVEVGRSEDEKRPAGWEPPDWGFVSVCDENCELTP
ncbi:MAG TPA: NosD domain-containing protein [Methanothrix sp.]|nr:NosD domain-containing protein [Methanothrix sp.]